MSEIEVEERWRPPDAWFGGVPLNRLARYLFEADGGEWWDSVKHVSQYRRSQYFAKARRILTVGVPIPKADELPHILPGND